MQPLVKSSKKKLLSTLDRISSLRVQVVGDFIVDRYIWGSVERISPEAPVPVVQVRCIEDRLGGAGNVVRNLRLLGVSTSITGIIGPDEEGEILRRLLAECAVDPAGILEVEEFTTIVKTRVIAHSQQVVRIDREEPHELSQSSNKQLLSRVRQYGEDATLHIVSDYGKGVVSKQVMKGLSEFSKRGDKVVVDPHPKNFSLYSNIYLAKPNRKEAESATGITVTDHASAVEAANRLLRKWKSEMMLLSLGEGGLLIVGGDVADGLQLKTTAREVYDVSGAGDTVTAVFAAAKATGASSQLAGDLANIAAGIVVSEVGTVAVDPHRLRERIDMVAK